MEKRVLLYCLLNILIKTIQKSLIKKNESIQFNIREFHSRQISLYSKGDWILGISLNLDILLIQYINKSMQRNYHSSQSIMNFALATIQIEFGWGEKLYIH